MTSPRLRAPAYMGLDPGKPAPAGLKDFPALSGCGFLLCPESHSAVGVSTLGSWKWHLSIQTSMSGTLVLVPETDPSGSAPKHPSPNPGKCAFFLPAQLRSIFLRLHGERLDP